MKRAKLGDYFEWMGQIVKCEWINEGQRAIGFRLKRKHTCPHCQKQFEIEEGMEVIEESSHFQTTAKPINTITE